MLTCPASVASTVSGVSVLQSILHDRQKLTNLAAYTAGKMLGQLHRAKNNNKKDMNTGMNLKAHVNVIQWGQWMLIIFIYYGIPDISKNKSV